MTLVDPVGDMFTRIRNGQMRTLKSVIVPLSKFRLQILEILKSEGYINNFFIEKKENKQYLIVDLKYYEGSPVIKEIKRILGLLYRGVNVFSLKKCRTIEDLA